MAGTGDETGAGGAAGARSELAQAGMGGSGSTATLSAAPGAGCLAVDDEVLLVNLQGTPSEHNNVGPSCSPHRA